MALSPTEHADIRACITHIHNHHRENESVNLAPYWSAIDAHHSREFDAELTRQLSIEFADEIPLIAGIHDEAELDTAAHVYASRALCLDGRYRILQYLGRGGFAVVYRALDCSLNAEVACKVPNQDDPSSFDRVRKEALLIAAVSNKRERHPNILHVVECSRPGQNPPFVATELIDGPTLAARLKTHRVPRTDDEVRSVLRLAEQLASALQHCHESGVIHRDLKPSNIVLRNNDPVLVDFGIAAEEAFRDLSIQGTPAYAAPEQLNPETPQVDAKSDIFSLGVVLYQLLTDELPHAGTDRTRPFVPVQQHNRIIREDVAYIVHRCLSTDPKDRFDSAATVVEEIRRAIQGDLLATRDYPLRRHIGQLAYRSRRPIAGLLAVATLFVVTGSILYYRALSDYQRVESLKLSNLFDEVQVAADDMHKRMQMSSPALSIDSPTAIFEKVDRIGPPPWSMRRTPVQDFTIATIRAIRAGAERPQKVIQLLSIYADAMPEAEHKVACAAQRALGEAYMRTERFDEAIAIFENMERLTGRPNNLLDLNMLSDCYLAADRLTDALRAKEMEIKGLHDNYIAAKINMAVLLFSADRFTDAIAMLEEPTGSHERDGRFPADLAICYYYLAMSHLQSGEIQQAAAFSYAAVSAYGKHFHEISIYSEHREAAASDFRQIVQLALELSSKTGNAAKHMDLQSLDKQLKTQLTRSPTKGKFDWLRLEIRHYWHISKAGCPEGM